MAMSDTAEDWFNYPKIYTGKEYYHIPGFDCGRRHHNEAEYIHHVNCTECLQALKDGVKHTLKPQERYKIDKENKEKQRINNIKHKWKQKYPNNPDCPSCGFIMIERVNGKNGNKFFGCCQYPNCKYTQKLYAQ